jgi:ComF family protein
MEVDHVDWLNRLLPPRRLLCGDPGTNGRVLCTGCDADLPVRGPACGRCAEPLPATGPGHAELTVCGACLWRPPPYVAIDVPFPYSAPIDWLVRRLKFHGDLAAGRLLGDLVAREVAPHLGTVDCIVPVPLHPARLRERGFNQVAELARPLARRLGLAMRTDALVRRRRGPPQMELPADRRRGNVRHAFGAGAARIPGSVLLVDDVVTTASTVREAARALRAAGADEVRVLAAARA